MNANDLSQLEAMGIAVSHVEAQLERFAKGFPYLDIVSAANPERGIVELTEKEQADALEFRSVAKVAKFVPASGAASRMFKDLFGGLDLLEKGETISGDSPAAKFCSNIDKFAFYRRELFDGKDCKDILSATLRPEGLGYGAKSKGQLLFHKYDDGCRTAFEEHLVEGALYAADAQGNVNIVFSVSPEHLEAYKVLFESVRSHYEDTYKVKYNITFTLQSPSTDTVAANPDGTPFRKADGSLLFRPGGHGALIGNVGNVDADVVIIKNIDNVVHASRIEETIRWKKIVAGRLQMLREKVFDYIRRIDEGETASEFVWEIVNFLDREFCVTLPDKVLNGPASETLKALRAKLDRPLRVCGMVRNQGEPGGGPFVVRDADGATSLQILESVQLDPACAASLLASATHFNPVDLACSITDKDGNHYNLQDYVDGDAGFISSKSLEGRPLKALELPGLWNGAMSNWNTQFVDVPLATFNPVKTVLDLLRPEHLG
ncbi:MAG: DUF4301 family protein [Bacteroidales bacterium]|nr:DUF4301 family protein [Bacteroidales bacterium]